jgi:hypothetical protein
MQIQVVVARQKTFNGYIRMDPEWTRFQGAPAGVQTTNKAAMSNEVVTSHRTLVQPLMSNVVGRQATTT